MAIPLPVLTTLPIPCIILLLLLTCYHLTPLLQLIPHLTPRLSKLANLIPHPRRPRNLPREFFNLPPRPEDSEDDGLSAASVLGVRGKLMLFLIFQTTLSVATGWSYLMLDQAQTDGRLAGALLALSIIPLPASIFTLAIFSAFTYQSNQRYYSNGNVLRTILAGGGVTHDTLYPRILPLSLVPTILVTIVSIALPSSAHSVILGSSACLVGSLLVMSLVGRYRSRQQQMTGAIRLRSTSPGLVSGEGSAVQELREKDMDDWVSSPGNASCRISEFSYSPSVATPRSHPRPHSRNEDGSPSSWISSPTATPATIPEWTWSPGDTIATPGSAITRERSRSPSPSLPIENMPDPIDQPRTAKSSATTMYTMSLSTPGSGLRSIGGSMLGEYSPDPFQPMPRNFQSLSSYPISPSQLATPDRQPTRSRTTLISNALRSADTLAFVPEERTQSTFTLNTHPSASDFVTPDRRRAPPPPPMPTHMPLPPTPTLARSETLFDWPHKESTEMLMGERDWVAVSSEGTEAGWGRDGKGVGIVALLTTLVTFALYSPLLILGVSDVTLSMYMISVLLSTPLLALTSHLLRYRPAKRLEKGSTRSVSHHRSLALLSESQLSLPITVSPKLTPPAEKRSTMMNDTLARLLGPKPSVSDFGYDRRPRPHTVYGDAQRDAQAEHKLKHVMARRSTDLWLEHGHAVEGGGIISRVTEMLKPYPAMRVLDSIPERPDTLTRLRGGVMSMMAKRKSNYDEEHSMANLGAPSISITSPSKFDKRYSGVSTAEGGDYDNDQTMGSAEFSAEIQVAQYGRMSRGPTVLCGPGHERADSYDVDWLGSKILPGLVPGLVIGPNVRVGPRPTSMGPPPPTQQFETSTPNRSGHSRGSSSSIDWTPVRDTSASVSTPDMSLRQRLRHKASFSLPNISPADFTDVRSSVLECGRDMPEHGIDLPLIPSNLSPVVEESERSLGSLALGVLHADQIGMDSMISEDEAMAQEMEQVLAMDTPTRAEFVISPPLSSYASGRLSRASRQSGLSYKTDDEAPPVPDIRRFSYSTDEESHPLVSTSNVNFSRPSRLQPQTSMPTMSHPHPPPLQHQVSYPSIAAVTNDLKRSSVIEAHPPLNARTLNNKKSNETMHSHMSSITDENHGRYDDAEEFRPSRQELTLVKQLRERAQSAQGHSEGASKPQTQRTKGLRPLQLVSDKNANRMSLPIQRVALGDKAKAGQGQGHGQMERVVQLQKGSNGTKGSKRSTGIGKENRSVHKGSATSGVGTGVGGLRI